MCSLKVIVVVAVTLWVLALESHCRDLGHNSITQKQHNVSNEENNKKTLNDDKTSKNTNQDTKKSSKNVKYIDKSQHAKKKNIVDVKSSVRKTRKADKKDKKFALSYSPGSQTAGYQQPTEGYSQDAASQQQYFASRYAGGNQEDGQANHQFEQQQQPQDQQQQYQQQEQEQQQQQPFSMMNGGEESMSSFQGPSNENQGENSQNVGMLQSLMEQRAAMYGQQEGNQEGEGEQRSYGQQQLASFQGQESGPQEDAQQYQQGMDREAPSQEMGMQEGQGQVGPGQEGPGQEGQGQEGQMSLSPEDESAQQGAGQVAAYQQESEQQPSQLQDMQQQSFNPEGGPQPGETEGGFTMKVGAQDGQEGQENQEQSYKANEESNENYSQENEGMQPTMQSMRPVEGGSLASMFAESNSQGGQDTQSIISEGQKITSSDAAQLAEAIENANKGLKGFKTLSNAANDNSGALSFTGGEIAGQSSDKKEGNVLPESNPGLSFAETQNFNEFPHTHSEMSNNINFESIYGKPQEQEFTHEFNGGGIGGEFGAAAAGGGGYNGGGSHGGDGYKEGGGHVGGSVQGHFHEEGNHVVNVHIGPSTMAHHAVKYCIGCPRNARCIDKVCLINGDEPLAKILGALSGPENITDDCKGCHEHARCVKKECICKPGYNGDGSNCKVDNCLPGCSKHGKCIRGFCVCDHHHYFNGIKCAPYKITPNQCPESCKATCFPHCPAQCCASSATPMTQRPTSQSSKKIASSFFLKPTLNQIDDVFNKNAPLVKPLSLKPTLASITNAKTGLSLSHGGQLLVSTDEPEKATNCAAECTTAKCGPACPDHCCKINNGKPNLKANQIDFLKSIAEKFCPTSCQNSCSNICPPVCCDKKTLISILSNSPGSTIVDMSKAEDIFRNAIGWFGMMNLMHMMYSMYGKGIKPETVNFPRAKPTKPLGTTAKSSSVPADICSPICKKQCLLSCPTSCCSANAIKRTNPLSSSKSPVKSNLLSENKGITRCPAACLTRCTPLCPSNCCKQSPAKTSVLKQNLRSCKAGCSPKCYPQCTDYCCKSLPSNPPSPANLDKSSGNPHSVVIQTTLYGCPTNCPKACYPSCKKECCTSPDKLKKNSPEAHGQYYVNIACPMECRPYNCLSYCHHECCLRKNSISPFIKVKSAVASKPTKTTIAPTPKTLVKN